MSGLVCRKEIVAFIMEGTCGKGFGKGPSSKRARPQWDTARRDDSSPPPCPTTTTVHHHLTSHCLPTCLPPRSPPCPLLPPTSTAAVFLCCVCCVCARASASPARHLSRLSHSAPRAVGPHLRCCSHRPPGLHSRRVVHPTHCTSRSAYTRYHILPLSLVFRDDSCPAASASCSSHSLLRRRRRRPHRRTCLAATHAAGVAFDVAHTTLCIVHTASIHPRHHRIFLRQSHPAGPSHRTHPRNNASASLPRYHATAK